MKRLIYAAITAISGACALLLVTAATAMAYQVSKDQADRMLRGISAWAPDNDIAEKGYALARAYGKTWDRWEYVNPWYYTDIWIGYGSILEGKIRFIMTDGTVYVRHFGAVANPNASPPGHDWEEYGGTRYY